MRRCRRKGVTFSRIRRPRIIRLSARKATPSLCLKSARVFLLWCGTFAFCSPTFTGGALVSCAVRRHHRRDAGHARGVTQAERERANKSRGEMRRNASRGTWLTTSSFHANGRADGASAQGGQEAGGSHLATRGHHSAGHEVVSGARALFHVVDANACVRVA